MLGSIRTFFTAFETRDVIAFAALVVSSCAIILTGFSHFRQKYESAASARKEMLEWFYQTTQTLMVLKMCVAQKKSRNDPEMATHMAKLCSLIELGRFYFPNMLKGDGFGKEKPLAYRGYNNVALEFLLHFYDAIMLEDSYGQFEHTYGFAELLDKLQREYTSIIYRILKPRKHIDRIRKHAGLSLAIHERREEFIKRNPTEVGLFSWRPRGIGKERRMNSSE